MNSFHGERVCLSVNEFCAAVGLSRSTVYKLIAAGELRTIRVAGRRLIPVAAAEELVNRAVDLG